MEIIDIKNMNLKTNKQKCEECGEVLGYSQYARVISSNGYVSKMEENLACRNFPHCIKAEVEARNGGCGCQDRCCIKCLSAICVWDNCPIHLFETKKLYRDGK